MPKQVSLQGANIFVTCNKILISTVLHGKHLNYCQVQKLTSNEIIDDLPKEAWLQSASIFRTYNKSLQGTLEHYNLASLSPSKTIEVVD